ncbi:MAG: hypothetical protein AAGF19_06315 [Pseudomonadota bacterium]
MQDDLDETGKPAAAQPGEPAQTAIENQGAKPAPAATSGEQPAEAAKTVEGEVLPPEKDKAVNS